MATNNSCNNTINTATIPLTSLQIKALSGTPITIVPTPGSGKFIYVLSAVLKFIYGGTTPFVGGSAIELFYTNPSGFQITNGLDGGGSITTGTTSSYGVGSVLYQPNALAVYANTPLVVTVVGADYTGDVANDSTISVEVLYYVVNV